MRGLGWSCDERGVIERLGRELGEERVCVSLIFSEKVEVEFIWEEKRIVGKGKIRVDTGYRKSIERRACVRIGWATAALGAIGRRDIK